VKSTRDVTVSDNCFLRVMTENDVTPAYVDGLNDPVVSRFLVGSRKTQQTAESVRSYVRANYESSSDFLFGIHIDGALRGTIRLHDVDSTEHTARIGILLFDRAYWRQGWATRVIEAVLRFAEEQLAVRCFWAGMRQENLGSRKTFEGLGFVYQPARDWTDPDGGIHHFFVRQ
jgi:RimJ/RimL family protein N-acetyltransferase